MKKIIIMILVILGLCGLVSVLLPFHILPLELFFVPKDKVIVDEMFDKEFPGYKKVEILNASGRGSSYSDPRLIAIRVTFEDAENPKSCESVVYFFRGDPGGRGNAWQSLDCEGMTMMIGMAQWALKPSTDTNHPIYSCFKTEIASILSYWVASGKTSIEKIEIPEIRAITEDMLSGKLEVKKQIVLPDQENKEIIDLAPEVPMDQKVKDYYLRCDGSLREYHAKSNMDIINFRTGKDNNDWQLHTPLPEQEDRWKIVK